MALMRADLLKLFPRARGDYLDALERGERLLRTHGVLGEPVALCAFLAQAAHETGGFAITAENGNYSAERLREIFPRHFTPAQARLYARRPQAVLSRAYASRMGNGGEASGDGWKYRGRSFFQTTGKDNYRRAAQLTGIDLVATPDLLASDCTLGLKAALMEWSGLDLSRIAADLGPTHACVLKVARGINCGNVNSGIQPNGLADRKAQFDRLWRAFGKTYVVAKLDPLADGVLEEGEEGGAVSALQKALAGLGYSVGKVDGIYGPRLAAAVAAFVAREPAIAAKAGATLAPGKWSTNWTPLLGAARPFEDAPRQDATAKDIAADGDTAMASMLWLRRGAASALAFLGLDSVAGTDGVQLPETLAGLKHAIDPLTANLQWLLGNKWALGAALCVGVVAISSAAIRAAVAKYRRFGAEGV